MAHGAIVVWYPELGPLPDLLKGCRNGITYNADSPEGIAYRCCPSPYSLKCVDIAFAQKYGNQHPRPQKPLEAVIDGVKEDIAWWHCLAFDAERYARYVAEGAPRKWFMNDATIVLEEMWSRTLGSWNERHDDASLEIRLLKYLRFSRTDAYPRDLAEAVCDKLRMAIRSLNVSGDRDYASLNRLWGMTRITPNTDLEDGLKNRIMHLRSELRRLMKYRERHPKTNALIKSLTADVTHFMTPLFDALDADDPKNPSLDVEMVSERLRSLEDRIENCSEVVAKGVNDMRVRDALADLLRCRRKVHEKLNNGGYSVSNDGCTVAQQFIPYEV